MKEKSNSHLSNYLDCRNVLNIYGKLGTEEKDTDSHCRWPTEGHSVDSAEDGQP